MNYALAGLLILCFSSAHAQEEIVYRRPVPYSAGTLDTRQPPSETDTFIYHQIFSTLFSFAEGEIKGDLVEKWKIEDQSRVYTFELRSAKFHDGSEFGAEDVKWTLERLIRADTYIGNQFTRIKKIKILAPNKVRVTLDKPTPSLLIRLTDSNAGILKKNEESSKLNGTGPFKLKRKVERIVSLSSNRAYYGKIPAIDQLDMVQATKEAATAGFSRGEFDDLFHYNMSESDQQAIGKNCERFDERLPMVRFFVMKKTKTGPLASAPLRSCLSSLIDRKAMGDAIDKGQPSLDSVLPRFILGGNSIEKFREGSCASDSLAKLRTASVANPIRIASTGTTQQAVDLLTNKLKAQSIKFSLVQAAEISSYLKELRKPQVDIYIGRYTARTPDTESFLLAFSGENAFWPVGEMTADIRKKTARIDGIEDRSERARVTAEIFNHYGREYILQPIQQFEFHSCVNPKWAGVAVPQVGFITQDLNAVHRRSK